MGHEPIRTLHVDQMPVHIFATNKALGARAADDLAAIIAEAIDARGQASLILATGNSQLSFMQALRQKPGIEWDKVIVFHMDEYLGMSSDHPASFPKYIREKLTDHVGPRAFYAIRGDTDYPISQDDMIHNIEVLEAVIRAADERETVRIGA